MEMHFRSHEYGKASQRLYNPHSLVKYAANQTECIVLGTAVAAISSIVECNNRVFFFIRRFPSSSPHFCDYSDTPKDPTALVCLPGFSPRKSPP